MDYSLFKDASQVDRILLWMEACKNFIAASELLTKEDAMLLKEVLERKQGDRDED